MAIRGAHFFAPYQRFGLRAARPLSPSKPARPLLRDDPDHVRQVAAALATALLDRHKTEPRGLLEGVLNHPATDPGAGRKLIHTPITTPVLTDLVPDDA